MGKLGESKLTMSSKNAYGEEKCEVVEFKSIFDNNPGSCSDIYKQFYNRPLDLQISDYAQANNKEIVSISTHVVGSNIFNWRGKETHALVVFKKY